MHGNFCGKRGVLERNCATRPVPCSGSEGVSAEVGAAQEATTSTSGL